MTPKDFIKEVAYDLASECVTVTFKDGSHKILQLSENDRKIGVLYFK